MRAAPSKARLLPGESTDVWTFQGRVLRGDPRTLEDSANGALGPTFHMRTGQKLRVVLSNDIPEETIVHWHGLRVPAAADGHPSVAIAPGGRYIYEFEVKGPAATYWYHAHPDRRTGGQVYRGLAGLFLVEDARESVPGLPTGAFDVALVLQDRRFDANNRLVYLTAAMERMTGFLGDRMLVNGTADFVMRVAARPYRMRVLNASNSRIYRLAWSDGRPLTILGTDGGLLETPARKQYAMLGPAERVELWADFGQHSVGSEASLVSLPFDAANPIRTGGVARAPAFTVVKVIVDRPSADRLPLPEKLRAFPRLRLADAINAGNPRKIAPTMGAMMSFGINGRTFEMNRVAADEHVKLGTLEAWEFDNTAAASGSGMMGMPPMPHPFHVHTGQFQILRREGVAHSGYIDGGWKDTVLVMPGEKATVLMRFPEYPGTYLYHCHNLEHEDGGMMRNFSVDA